MKHCLYIFIVLFLFGCYDNLNEDASSKEKTKVLVVHSFYASTPWVTDVNEGIDEAFTDKNVEIERIYMDAEKTSSPAYKVAKGQEVMELYNRWQPEIILTVGNDARKYFSNKLTSRSDVQMVFCGVTDTVSVNRSYRPGTKGYFVRRSANETGILERPELFHMTQTIKEMVKNAEIKEEEPEPFMDPSGMLLPPEEPGSFIPEPVVAPKPKPENKVKNLLDTITVLTDESIESLAFINHLEINKVRLGVHVQKIVSTSDLFEWEEVVANPEADALVIFGFEGLEEQNLAIVDPNEVKSWTAEIAKVPTIVFEEQAVERGCLLAFVTNGYDQGYEGARICLRLMNGERTDNIPVVVVNKGYFVANRYTADRLGINLTPYDQEIKTMH